MNPVIELVAVFVLRALQAAVLCLPTLLSGMVVAGMIRAIVGRENMRRWLGQGSNADLLRAWVLAFFLPVCSFGVLPVIVTLRAMGSRWGPLVVIAIASPLVTPWTLGYLIDRTGPLAFSLLIASNAMIALAAGFIVDRLVPSDGPLWGDAPDVLPTRSTLLNALWSAGAALSGRVLALIGVGLLGVGAVAICIPPNAVGDWLVERGIVHAGILSVIPFFTYVTPEMAAMQAGEVVRSSLMPGLIVPLIGLGVAIHSGTLLGFGHAVGIKRLLLSLGVIVLVAVIWSIATDVALYDGSYSPEDSHAFEDYGRPFHLLDHPDGPIAGFFDRLRRPLGMNAVPAGVAIVLILISSTWIGRRGGTVAAVELRFITRRWASVTANLIVLATIALSAYTYYPPPSALKRELQAMSAEFSVSCRRGEQQHAQRLARQIDRRLTQFSKSAILHGRLPSAEHYAMIEDARQGMKEAMDGAADPERARAAEIRFQLKLRDFIRTF